MELMGDDISGASEMTNLAQYLVSIKRFSKKEKEGEKDGRGGYKNGKEPIEEDTEINVMKNRYSGRTNTIRCYFDYSSYRFYNTHGELFKRYKWNKDESPLPTKDVNEHCSMPEIFKD